MLAARVFGVSMYMYMYMCHGFCTLVLLVRVSVCVCVTTLVTHAPRSWFQSQTLHYGAHDTAFLGGLFATIILISLYLDKNPL